MREHQDKNKNFFRYVIIPYLKLISDIENHKFLMITFFHAQTFKNKYQILIYIGIQMLEYFMIFTNKIKFQKKSIRKYQSNFLEKE